MFISKEKKLTFSRHFLRPLNASHRQYEALRAYFVEGLASADAAARFGYAPGSFRSLVHQFRQDPERSFFAPSDAEAQQSQRHDDIHQRVVALRKQNLSIYDIRQSLLHEGIGLSPVAVDRILKQEGFARLPRRLDDERPPGTRPTCADVADVQQLDLGPAIPALGSHSERPSPGGVPSVVARYKIWIPVRMGKHRLVVHRRAIGLAYLTEVRRRGP